MGPNSPSDALYRFEEAWQRGVPPSLESYLPPVDDRPARRDALRELVPVDLEYRWRRVASQGGSSWVLEDYVRHFPELGGLEQLSPQLIAEEYRVRHRWGDTPATDVYLRRFPSQAGALVGLLRQMDGMFLAERSRRPASGAQANSPSAIAAEATLVVPSSDNGDAGSTPSVLPLPGNFQAHPLLSVAALLETLRHCELLGPAQLAELFRGPTDRFADVHALAHELLCRDWLTSYQVNQLLQGRAHQLVLGPYRLLERLGAGGAGQVFKARHQKMNRLVALKLLHDELSTDSECVGRFLREIQIVSRLDHPNLIQAYDAGPLGSSYFLAMKYVEGTDLGRLVKKGGPLLLSQACEYIRQAALGLQHLHEHGLVHRDIKPHNLMIGRDNTVKVADLGLARGSRGEATELTSARSTGSLTPAGAGPMGTTDYLAPEQAIDFHSADIRADIYSLGCTFWYLLIGQPLFPGRTLAETLLSHQTREPPALEQLRADVPPWVATVLRRMLAKNPDERYQSPAEVADALAPYSSAVPVPEAEFELGSWSLRAGASTTWQMLRNFARKNKTFTASVLTGVVTALVLLTWSSVVNYRAWKKAEDSYARYRSEQETKEERTREAIPALVGDAEVQARQGDLPRALRQLALALEWDPEYAPAHLLKGQLLVGQLKFEEAQAALRRYLQLRPADTDAKELLLLSQNVHRQDSERLRAINDLLRRQSALGASRYLEEEILKRNNGLKANLPLWQRKLDRIWPGLGKQLVPWGKGLVLNCSNREDIKDLSPLKDLGIPITNLSLVGCVHIKDLTPLQGMPLTALNLSKCIHVRELSPLQGMQLSDLILSGCMVQNLSPLKEMRLLRRLVLRGCPVQDLGPLKDLQLTELNLEGCKLVTDLSPLKRIPLQALALSRTKVTDLSALKDTQLHTLELEGTGVTDVSVLKGMPLVTLNLAYTSVTDLTPLEGMHQLAVVTLPKQVAKGMSTLRRIKGITVINQLAADDFWKNYDDGKFKDLKP